MALATALALLALPVLAQDTVYTGCLRSADGTLYNVAADTAPKAPCKGKDTQINWNMAGLPGPEGPPGPPLPWEVWATVDCDAGERINDALARQAVRLGIRISGTCREAVSIRRDHVILVAQDPSTQPLLIHDGAPAVEVAGARDVALYDLKITGSAPRAGGGLSVVSSDVQLMDCELWSNGVAVRASNLSNVAIVRASIHDNGEGVRVEGGSHLDIGDSVVERHDTGIGGSSSSLDVYYTTVQDNSIGIRQDRGGRLRTEGSVVSGSDEGLVLNTGSAAELNGTTFTHNRSTAIGGEGGVSVKLYGGVTISDNGGGIGLSNGASLAFRSINSITGNGVGISLFNSAFHAFSAGEMRVSGNGTGISCTLTSGACVQSDITDSISGCGSMCPDQPDQP